MKVTYKWILQGMLVVSAVVLLASCETSRKYRSPEVDTSGLFRDDHSTDTTTIADIPWRNYFTDPYLITLIEAGLENNFDLQIAYTRIKAAEANLMIARNAYFPTVALAGQVEHTQLSNGLNGKNTLGYSSTSYSLGIAATWEADIWGKMRKQQRAQYAAYLNSFEYRNLIQTSLIANIATSYYALLALDEQLNITRETVVLLDENTRTIQALLEAGMVTGAAVEQSRALYYSTMVTIPDLENQIRQTENALSTLIGVDPGPIYRSRIADLTVPEFMAHGIPAQMLARRPDVRQAELVFRSAYELTGAARAAFYPSITLATGSIFGYGSTTLSSFFRPENLLANVIGQLAQPLYARRQLKGNLRIAEAQQEEALLTFSKTVLSAGQEVSDILYGFDSSLSKNETRYNQIRSLRTAVYFTQELLKAGEANYTEVLTAEQNYLTAQLGQVSDKLEQLQYTVNLYRALGGGTF